MKKNLISIAEIAKSKVRKKLSPVVFLGTALLLALSLAMPAMAIIHYGVFELDGNATDDSPNTAVNDWQDLFGTVPPFTPNHTDHSIAKVFLNDVNSTSMGDVEFSGNTKDIQDISQWTWTAHEPQTKVTFNDTYAAAYNVNGNTIVEFGADRIDSSGAANEGFWLLQNPISLNSNGTFNGTHKNGDILVISSFTVGGTVSTIEVFKWNFSDTANNSLTPQPQFGTNVTCAPGLATSNVNLCAAVNSNINGYPGIIPAPWPYATTSGLSTTFPVNTFMEGGLNLTAVLPQSSTTGQCVTTFVAETRSSPSTTATLSDFMMGTFNLCGGISGQKFNDLNGNGKFDKGEPTLSGWTINLINSTGAIVNTTTTDSNGSYSFVNVLPGTYTLNEVLKPGWIQTAAINGTNAVSAFPNITVNIQGGGSSTGNNFGNFQNGSIYGMKFNDLNDNGSLDAGEPGLGRWTINLDGTDTITGSTVHLTTITASDGTFNFTNLTNGTYTLSEQLQTGWIQTAAIPGNNASAAFPNITVNIQSGTNSTNNNFGNFQLRHLSFIKSGSLDMSDGKTLNYTINATNDGFAPLDILNITDPNDNIATKPIGQTCNPPLPILPLAHGQSVICNTTYSATALIPNINAPTIIEFEVNGTSTPINLSI